MLLNTVTLVNSQSVVRRLKLDRWSDTNVSLVNLRLEKCCVRIARNLRA